jgi:DNA polymerase III alpha subunit (gram-positive type)
VEPPAHSIWDAPIDRVSFAAFDLEMTGLDPDIDEIVEIAAVIRTAADGPVEFDTVVRSTRALSPGAAALHGIAPEEISRGAPADRALDAFLNAIDGCVLVGHGIKLDLQFLQRAIARWLPGRMAPAFAIDTLTLARRAVCAKRYTLESLCSTLGLPVQRFHRARGDALATMALFEHLKPMFAPTSARDLWEVRAGQVQVVHVRRSIAERIQALVRSQCPAQFVVRNSGQAPRTVRGTVEHWNEPHVRIRPSSEAPILLRADRILRIEPLD